MNVTKMRNDVDSDHLTEPKEYIPNKNLHYKLLLQKLFTKLSFSPWSPSALSKNAIIPKMPPDALLNSLDIVNCTFADSKKK